MSSKSEDFQRSKNILTIYIAFCCTEGYLFLCHRITKFFPKIATKDHSSIDPKISKDAKVPAESRYNRKRSGFVPRDEGVLKPVE